MNSRFVSRQGCIVFFAAVASLFQFSRPASAGIVTIGSLTPSPSDEETPRFGGLTFEGKSNALLIDGLSWSLSSVSMQNAGVVSLANLPPPPFMYDDQLAYDPTTGNLYTLEEDSTLVAINSKNQISIIGSGIGASGNFDSLAVDPSGNLWLATDVNGGELWSINKQTGVATPRTQITLPANFQLTSMAIDSSDNFVVYGRSESYSTPSDLFDLNPATGATTLLTQGDSNPIAYPISMAFDPLNNNLYGIVSDASVQPRAYSLVEFTGVPEPTSAGILCGVAATLLCQRKPRKTAA